MRSSVSTCVPARFSDRTLVTFMPSDGTATAFDAARQMVDTDIDSLVLSGPAGAGKTHLAAAVANARHGLWCNVPEFMSALKSQMGITRHALLDNGREPATDHAEMLADYPGLVVLDDLGREKVTDWTGEIVYVLINTRYENRRPTLVTTNLTGAELGASPYWPAISRLAEDGALVAIDAPDHRLAR